MSTNGNDRLDAIAHAVLQGTGSNGVLAGTALFERIIDGLTALITAARSPETEVLRFPPVMSRKSLEKSGYLDSFPHLLGCVSALHGSEAEIRSTVAARHSGADWAANLAPTDVVLAPAACYPVYPLAAERGPVPADGLFFDVASYCFRREATHELGRFTAFRMREFVCIADAGRAGDFRAAWVERADELARRLDLPHHIAPASDPFFGRTGKFLALSQLEQALKFELLIPLHSDEQPTACMSFNCHRDHFGTIWGLRTKTGEVAHTACVAFGLERLALALFAVHGLEPRRWPSDTRAALSLDAPTPQQTPVHMQIRTNGDALPAAQA